MSFSYDFGEVFEGALTTGVDATYVHEYEQSAFTYGGVFISPTYDAVGYTNYDRFPGTIPEWRAIGNINYKRGPFNFRYEVRYIDSVKDNRAPISVPNATEFRFRSRTVSRSTRSFRKICLRRSKDRGRRRGRWAP